MKKVKKAKVRKKRQTEGVQIVCYIDIDIKMEAHTPSMWEIEKSQGVQKTLTQRGFPRAVLNTPLKIMQYVR
jgi:hypothetical protein